LRFGSRAANNPINFRTDGKGVDPRGLPGCVVGNVEVLRSLLIFSDRTQFMTQTPKTSPARIGIRPESSPARTREDGLQDAEKTYRRADLAALRQVEGDEKIRRCAASWTSPETGDGQRECVYARFMFTRASSTKTASGIN
jgi:hypothetical protein